MTDRRALFSDSQEGEPTGVRSRRGRRPVRWIPIVIALLPAPFIVLYFIVRAQSFLAPGYTVVALVISVLLFIGDLFFLTHTISYLTNFLRSTQRYDATIERYLSVYSPEASVAILIASFNEPPEVIEPTLSAATVAGTTIGNYRIYLLDDSTDPEIRTKLEQLALRYGAKYVHRSQRGGFKAGAMNAILPQLTTKYFTVLDADQRPLPDYLAETIPYLESDPKLAFVQVPQVYTNTDASRIALGAHYVQLVFFDYITEGKSCTNSMFSCGSNTIFRTQAVLDVGGFYEKSVTEDMATSIKIHEKGWKSLYYNKPLVAGEGPATLNAYFTQQARWSLGSIGLCFMIIKDFFRHPGRMRLAQWWDYFVTTTWYFVGWVNIIMLAGVLAFVFLGLTPIIPLHPDYFTFLIPYILFSMVTFTLSTAYRGHPPVAVLYNLSLTYITSPIYAVSAILVVLKRRRPFRVTPKNFTGGKLPLTAFWPQLMLLGATLTGIGVSAIKYGMSSDWVFLLSLVWLSYYAFLLSFLFFYNTDAKMSQSYAPTFQASL
ncbi:MAG: glycosyltransferase family 2 protein [Thermoplasmata archaeon]